MRHCKTHGLLHHGTPSPQLHFPPFVIAPKAHEIGKSASKVDFAKWDIVYSDTHVLFGYLVILNMMVVFLLVCGVVWCGEVKDQTS